MAFRKYNHVIIVGIDGAGAFFQNANTPHFDRIFANGSITYSALSSKPTISAECWGSMLLGVGPEIHNLTNTIVSQRPYPIDSQFPSVFRRIHQVYPDAKMGSFCDWNPITFGIVENNLNIATATARDDELVPTICDYIRKEKPDFLFMQFDSVDGAGHRNGYGTTAHLQRIQEVDRLINDVYHAIEDSQIADETLFMVIADHGGANTPEGKGTHGGWSDSEKYVTFAATGNNVKHGSIDQMNIRDLAAIVLYAFGIELPAFREDGWSAQIPAGIFDDPTIPQYRDISHLTGAAARISSEPHKSTLL